MLSSDILITLQWWFTILILGIGFLPLTVFLFKNFFDRGYIFSKILSLTITSYSIFILGLFHILPFSTVTSIVVFLLLTLTIFFIFRRRQSIIAIFKQYWKIFLFEELLFLTALFFWTYIHTFAPDINGLEKFMDYGFINSILRTEYFPPKDMWFTPLPINYYYFGHLITAVLTQISGIPSNFTFNLMLATIFALCFTQSFSIASNLYHFIGSTERFMQIKRLIAGILSASLVTFAGNLHILYAFFKAYPNESPVPLWQLPFLPLSFPNEYWYPNATRFIHNTIHEFPIYSWTVADLHGHVLDIPVVLLIIAVLFSLFTTFQIKNNQSKIASKKPTSSLGYWILIGFLLAVAYMTNAWDGGIYLLLALSVIFYLHSRKGIAYKQIIIASSVVFLGFLVFVTPYNAHFKPFVSGIGVLCAPEVLVSREKIGPLLFEADHCQRSPWWQLLTLYGFFYFFILSFLFFGVKIKKLLPVDHFVLILILLGTFLILIPEFFYIKDIYPAHYRANTMFKLVFQAFIMLSFASGYIMVRLIQKIKDQKSKIFNFYSLFFIFSFSFFILVMLYPYQAINAYYGNLQNPKGLDGTAYLQTLRPGDYEAIRWLNNNVKGQPVILEAQGDSYTDYARISANTGLPTVLGWTVHEWLWRGTYDIPAPRIEEIKTIYETNNIGYTKTLLQKYNVEYVVVGPLEYEKYLNLNEEKFSELGEIMFEEDKTKIYKLNSL